MSVLCFTGLRRFSEAKVRNFEMSSKKNVLQNYIREKVELSYVTLSKIINTILYCVVCDAALLLSEMRFVYICSMSCPYSVSYRPTPDSTFRWLTTRTGILRSITLLMSPSTTGSWRRSSWSITKTDSQNQSWSVLCYQLIKDLPKLYYRLD